MSDRAIIAERLRRKEGEIQSLEEKIRSARIYVQALHDILHALDRDPPDASAPSHLKSGSSVAMAREVIARAGRPIHISELLEALGKGTTKVGRASLTSSLAAYVRKGEIFTRPAPNTFGLVELGHTSEPQTSYSEPPPGFGRLAPNKSQDDDADIPF